jgi:hypothetical protein
VSVEPADSVRYLQVIDSDDPALVGQWFARKASQLMSVDARHGDLLELAGHILEVLSRLQDIERDRDA